MAKRELKKIWCIAYVTTKYVDLAERDLNHNMFQHIEVFIPTVKILKKTFKGQQEFDEIPLLFNYGFFKMPAKLASNPDYLAELRDKVSCIYGWVKDPLTVFRSKPILRPKNDFEYGGGDVGIAMATDEEIAALAKSQELVSIYSSDDLDSVTEGSIITLHGYPFDNIDAEVLEIRTKKQEVRVRLLLEQVMSEVTVSFDNVFYTIYQGGYDESRLKEKSLEEMESNTRTNIDKLMANLNTA